MEDGAKGLALLEMPNLRKIDNIHLLGISGNVNLPNVESLGDVELIQTSDKGSIDLGSLAEASSVFVGGSWTRYGTK